nr:RNA-directed DNA polymerase, eukaryota [Tanacetum cinerariifolium]
MSRVQAWTEVVDKKSVLDSKEKGGLGVSSLYALNRALMMKWVWRFYSQKESLWARVIKVIYGDDGQVGKVSKAGSRSCWRNIVNEVRILSNQGIYALETEKEVTVNSKMSDTRLKNSLRRSIRGGVEQVQFNDLSDMLQSVSLMPYSDRWVWSLEGSGEFFVASIRKIIDDNRLSTVDTRTFWIKYVPIKVNVLAWKIKIEALPKRFNISRRGIDIDSILCPICECGVESARHVFFSCSLVRQIVRKVCSWWDVMYIDVNSYVEWFNWMNSLRLKSKSKLMIEVVTVNDNIAQCDAAWMGRVHRFLGLSVGLIQLSATLVSYSCTFYKKNGVSDIHSKSLKGYCGCLERRFCQKCSRFLGLPEFDGKKRSCRKRLANHNARRRKPHQEAVQFNSRSMASSYYVLAFRKKCLKTCDVKLKKVAKAVKGAHVVKGTDDIDVSNDKN